MEMSVYYAPWARLLARLVAQKLVAKAEAWASEEGVNSLYLLTTTAARFFARLGYEVVPRSQAPSSIENSAQFAGLCPVSATFMCKTLAANKTFHLTSR